MNFEEVFRPEELDALGDILRHVKNPAKYLDQLLNVQQALTTLPQGEISLDLVERLTFEPQDVEMANRNWAIDFFGTEMDYEEMEAKASYRKLKIYVMDTGIPNHPELRGTSAGGKYYTGETGFDRNGHATHVGGYFGANNEQANPLYRFLGDIKVWYGGVLNAAGSGGFAGIEQAAKDILPMVKEDVANGITPIVNYSLGAFGISTPVSLGNALDALKNAGAFIVAATGNNGRQGIAAPANHRAPYAIGALNTDGKNAASFSNYDDGIFGIAPGVMIYSLALNSGYRFVSGTSMGTPLFGAAVCIALKLYPQLNASNIEAYLKKTLVDLPPVGYDFKTGNGAPVIRRFLDNVPEGAPTPPPAPPKPNPPHEPVPAPPEPEPPVDRRPRRVQPRKVNILLDDAWRIPVRVSGIPGEEFVTVSSVVVTLRSDLAAEELVPLINKLSREISSSFGLLIPEGKDFIYAGGYICFFMEMFFKTKQDIALDVVSAIITDEAGSSVIVDYEDIPHHGVRIRTQKTVEGGAVAFQRSIVYAEAVPH